MVMARRTGHDGMGGRACDHATGEQRQSLRFRPVQERLRRRAGQLFLNLAVRRETHAEAMDGRRRTCLGGAAPGGTAADRFLDFLRPEDF